jgi:uncharacterized protein (TIGR02246 family)
VSPAEQTARALLDELQTAVSRKDEAAVADVLDEEVVLFGTAAESVGREAALAYVGRVLAGDEVLRWGWDRVLVLHEGPGALAFAVIGSVGFDDHHHGEPVEDRQPFRLTCVAVERAGRWRLRHFHGSVPPP